MQPKMFKYPLKQVSQKTLHNHAKKLSYYRRKYQFVQSLQDVPKAKMLSQVEALNSLNCMTCDRSLALAEASPMTQYNNKRRQCLICACFMADREIRRKEQNRAFMRFNENKGSRRDDITMRKKGKVGVFECVDWKPDRLLMDENKITKQMEPRCKMTFLPKSEMLKYHSWCPLRKQLTFDCMRIGLLK